MVGHVHLLRPISRSASSLVYSLLRELESAAIAAIYDPASPGIAGNYLARCPPHAQLPRNL